MESSKLFQILEQQLQRRENLAQQGKFPQPTVLSCKDGVCALNTYTRILHMYGAQVYAHITNKFWWSGN